MSRPRLTSTLEHQTDVPVSDADHSDEEEEEHDDDASQWSGSASEASEVSDEEPEEFATLGPTSGPSQTSVQQPSRQPPPHAQNAPTLPPQSTQAQFQLIQTPAQQPNRQPQPRAQNAPTLPQQSRPSAQAQFRSGQTPAQQPSGHPPPNAQNAPPLPPQAAPTAQAQYHGPQHPALPPQAYQQSPHPPHHGPPQQPSQFPPHLVPQHAPQQPPPHGMQQTNQNTAPLRMTIYTPATNQPPPPHRRGPDYIPGFETSCPLPGVNDGEFVAVFSSWEVLYHHVQAIAKKQGYRVVKRRSSAYKDGKPMRYDLSCDRGGKYKNSAVIRKPHTKKTECPWKARASCMWSLGNQWKFVVMNGHHNHPPRDPNAPKPGTYLKKKPKTPPPVETGVMPLGRELRADDELAQNFMTAVEEAQEKEKEKSGKTVADALVKIQASLAKVESFQFSLERIEQFAGRLSAIEYRLGQIEARGSRMM